MTEIGRLFPQKKIKKICAECGWSFQGLRSQKFCKICRPSKLYPMSKINSGSDKGARFINTKKVY